MIREMYNRVDGVKVITDAHQIEAYEHLASNERAALFLGMSLFKTVTSLSFLYDMHYKECAFLKTIVIAPDKVARITWPDEINKWAHLDGLRFSLIAGDPVQRLKALNTDAEVYIIGVDNLTWLIDQFIKQNRSGKWIGSWPFDSMVIDELSLFKSRSSERFKKLKRAVNTTDNRIGLTGTPSPNGYIDLWAQLFLLDDGQRLGDTFGKYLDAYFRTRGNGQIVFEYIPKTGAANVIAHKIRDIALTMQTDDYIKLPKLHTVDEVLTFNEFDGETYSSLEREYAIDFLEGGEVTVKTAADLTMKLLQISSGAIYEDREDPKAPRIWHEVNTLKIEALGNLLNDYPDETFLVVYQFRHEIDRIKAAFPFARELRKGKGTVEDFKDWNAGRIRLLLIHPAGAGHGLNLQFGGRRMVWFSVTWNLEHYLQTIARLKRRGQLREMYIHRLLVKGTRDMKVRAKLESKDTNQTFLLNEIKDLRKRYGNLRK